MIYVLNGEVIISIETASLLLSSTLLASISLRDLNRDAEGAHT